MTSVRVFEQVRQIAVGHADPHADRAGLSTVLRNITVVRSWLAAVEADVTSRLAATSSFPEKDIADCTRGSTRDAIRTKERSDTLGRVEPLADALHDGRVTTGHIDALTRAGKQLDTDQERNELFDRAAELTDVAAVSTVDEFRRRLKLETDRIRRSDGMDRLARQRRATRLRTWTDDDGMWRVDGRFDPSPASRSPTASTPLFRPCSPTPPPTPAPPTRSTNSTTWPPSRSPVS